MSNLQASRPRASVAWRRTALLGALTVSLCGWISGASAADCQKGPLKAQVVVRLEMKSQLGSVLDFLGNRACKLDEFPGRPVYLLQVTNPDDVSTVISQLEDRGAVFAERNRPAGIQDWLYGDDPLEAARKAATAGTIGPAHHETRRNSVVAIEEFDTLQEPAAVTPLLRLDLAHGASTGVGTRVAILDTGADLDHPWFGSSFQIGGGKDFVDGVDPPSECCKAIKDPEKWAQSNVGHGTHVAGIVHRVAPAARLIIGRILDPKGQGTTWLTAKAIVWAMDPNENGNWADDGAHVINLSLATKYETKVLELASDVVTCAAVPTEPAWADDQARCIAGGDALVVAGVGNDSHAEVQFPAGYEIPGLMAVAASDNRPTKIRHLAYFSNTGKEVDVVAPGWGIHSAFYDNWHAYIAGTSQAAPMVSGLAALVRETDTSLSAPQLRRIIKRNTVPMCDDSGLRHIDVAGTLGATPLPPCPPPPPPRP